MFGLSISQEFGYGEVGVEKNHKDCVEDYGYDNLSFLRVMARSFLSEKHSSQYVGNVGIYSVGRGLVYQI